MKKFLILYSDHPSSIPSNFLLILNFFAVSHLLAIFVYSPILIFYNLIVTVLQMPTCPLQALSFNKFSPIHLLLNTKIALLFFQLFHKKKTFSGTFICTILLKLFFECCMHPCNSVWFKFNSTQSLLDMLAIK